MIASGPLVTSSVESQQRSRFLRTLHKELSLALVPEMEVTLKVAVMSAAGLSRAEIGRRLDVGDIELKMAFERLKKIAKHWV